MIIRPFESFAKDLFGVLRMEELLAACDEFGKEYPALREAAWNSIPEPERQAYRELARRYS